jgi:hypothetical protein
MHEGNDTSAGSAHVPNKTFSAKEMNFLVSILRIYSDDFTRKAPTLGEDREDYRRDLAVMAKKQLPDGHPARRDNVRSGGCLTAGVIDLRL